MENSACEIVTVALRRVDIDNPEDSLLSHINLDRYLLLPNTSGAEMRKRRFAWPGWPVPQDVNRGLNWK